MARTLVGALLGAAVALAASSGAFDRATYEERLGALNRRDVQDSILGSSERYERYHEALVEYQAEAHGGPEFRQALLDSALRQR